MRCPGTNVEIRRTYQSTSASAALSYCIMFPQVIGSASSDPKFVPANLVTVPLGCLGYADTACEAALDTVFWPADFMLSAGRSK